MGFLNHMSKLGQRGVIQLLVPLILLIGIITGVYLVVLGDPLKLFSKAAPMLPSAPETSFELELEKTGVSPFPDEATPTYITNGTTFRVDIYVRSDLEAANLFSAQVKYTSDTVDFVSVEKRDGQSFIKNWVNASSDNGVVSLVGGVPNPGIQTDSKTGSLLMGSVIFKAKQVGIARIGLSDGNSAIYSNVSNINILTVTKGTLEVPVQDMQPSPTPTPQPLSCSGTIVTGAIESKIPTGETIYIAESEGKVKLAAQITPLDTKMQWVEASRSKNLPAGRFDDFTNATTYYIAPSNEKSRQMEGVTIRADVPNTDASKNPLTSCPVVNLAIKPVIPIPPPTINTLDYFITKHPGKGLTGTHPFSQTIDGQTSYQVKWDTSIFEIHKWDENFIYLNEDHSGAPVNFYSFKPGIWMKRNMQIGEKITENDNIIEWFNPSCRSLGKQSFPIEITLEKRIPDYDLGGDLGKQDVIILKYDSSLSNPKGIYERFYYSKEWGWVKWEEYSKTDDSKPTNTSIFNKISSEEPLNPNKAVACVSERHIQSSTLSDKGDGNNDGKIDLVDLSILLTDFNKTNGLRKGIDMNGDGIINTFDFSLIRTPLIQKGFIKG